MARDVDINTRQATGRSPAVPSAEIGGAGGYRFGTHRGHIRL